jgi:hypothetical protein
MKNLYFFLFALLISISAKAQTIPGGDMETWRNTTSGAIAPTPVHAPAYWYGLDSVIISLGQAFSSFLGVPPTSFHSQVFEENTIVHDGAHSAKLITVFQDSLVGYLPGVLANAQTIVTIDFATMSLSSFKYTGGGPVSQKPLSVSAWVQYYPGKDSTGRTGADTGLLTVEAVSQIGTVDSVIGTGTVAIPPYSSWAQVTANIAYPLDTTDKVDTIRIIFSSSGGGRNAVLDSSTLYVDDVSMVSRDNAVPNIANSNDPVKIYPNPANETIYLDAAQNKNLVYQLFTISGKAIITRPVNGNESIDVSALPSALYFYTITDNNGNMVQKGKVSVVR